MSLNIISPDRSSWDVIGRAIGADLSRNLPGTIEQVQARQRSMNALDQAEKDIAEANGDPIKIAFAMARARAQTPAASYLPEGIGQQNKAQGENIAGDRFSKGYEALKNGDLDTFNKIIKDPATPYNVKKQLTDIYNQGEVRKDVHNRELRGRQNLVLSTYAKAIAEEQNKLEQYPPKAERDAITTKIKKLEAMRRKDMNRLVNDIDSYPELSVWSLDDEFLPEEGMEGMGAGRQGPRVKFNPNNPNHKTRAQQLYKQLGDKEKVREELSKEFEGL